MGNWQLKKMPNAPLSPDARISLAAIQYRTVIKATIGFQDEEGQEYLERMIRPYMIK